MQVQKISDTAQKFNGATYYLCGQYFQRKGRRLHRMVWEFHNGSIPEGYDVHHINGNKADNDIENLQLLDSTEHHGLHMNEPDRKAQSRANIEKAREAAKEWHSTTEGKDFHSRHAKKYWDSAKLRTYTCTYCGKEFQSRCVYGKDTNTFCCNNHKAAWRRKQGIDNETRICAVCGKEFTVIKYSQQKCCSRECARKKRWGK